jgi:hypothetical protein
MNEQKAARRNRIRDYIALHGGCAYEDSLDHLVEKEIRLAREEEIRLAMAGASPLESVTEDCRVDLRTRALKLYRPPFRFEHGYIFDAANEVVADSRVQILRVRGWGRISYLPEPERLQDAVGSMIAEALTSYWKSSTEGK